MGEELVARLRSWDKVLFGVSGRVSLDGPNVARLWKDVAEAVNEIERLRATIIVCEKEGEGVSARVISGDTNA